ncbi:MAG: O-antigen ligase family protein [Pirellula sp.]|jgi:O-antigen ligase
MSLSILFIQACWAYSNLRAILTPWIGYVGYAVFVVLCPQWNWRWGWDNSIDYQKFLAITTIIGTVLTGAFTNKISGISWKSIGAILLFLSLAYISSFQTIAPRQTTFYMDKIWKIVLMCVLGILLIDDSKKLSWLVGLIVLAQAWNAFNINELYYKWGIRVDNFTWNFNDSNTYAVSTVTMMALSFAIMLVYKNYWLRICMGLIFVLQMHQIMILQSRGTMLGGIVLGVLGFLFMPKTKYAYQVFGVGLLCGVILAGPSVVEEFASSFSAEEELDSSAQSRFDIWKAGVRITADNPILGVGPWAGQVLVPELLGMHNTKTKSLHNLLFEMSAGCGVPAATCYLAYFFLPWFVHLRYWLKGKITGDDHLLRTVNLATLCGIPGYWVASMFSAGALLEPSYILVVCSCAACTILEKRELGLDDDHHEDDIQEDLDSDSEMDEDFEEDQEQELVANR